VTLRGALEAALGRVQALAPLSGGDINDAYRVELADGRRYFVKTRADAPAGMYEREAEGLAWLAEANALPCPGVVAVDARFLVLEYVEPARRAASFELDLGRGLAALHRFGAPSFGLSNDNFIAHLPQANQPLARFSDFYRERRLVPLVARAGALLDRATRARFDRLYARLDSLIPQEPPARLHGDLWSGNVHCTAAGKPMLIDPAVYGGARELDLAMLQLFGSPSPAFFAGYDEVYPRSPAHDERVPLFQLYPLLVHLNLFGASYLSGVQRALARYE
jgi:fructosamine-3-kinase